MATVDPLFAQWLQGEADWVTRSHAGLSACWGEDAGRSERVTGIATRAAAEAEADRQLAFFARGPFAEDVHQLPGVDWSEQLGRVVRLHADQFGYANGADVFVIATEVNRATGISQVTVLVPLEALA
jgi:hypothetical protein